MIKQKRIGTDYDWKLEAECIDFRKRPIAYCLMHHETGNLWKQVHDSFSSKNAALRYWDSISDYDKDDLCLVEISVKLW